MVSAPEGGSGRAAGNRSKGVGVRWVWRPHRGGAGSTGSRSPRSWELGLRRSELGDQGRWVKSGMLEIEVMAVVVMGDRSRVCLFVTSMDFSGD